jgi:hypothetical protein
VEVYSISLHWYGLQWFTHAVYCFFIARFINFFQSFILSLFIFVFKILYFNVVLWFYIDWKYCVILLFKSFKFVSWKIALVLANGWSTQKLFTIIVHKNTCINRFNTCLPQKIHPLLCIYLEGSGAIIWKVLQIYLCFLFIKRKSKRNGEISYNVRLSWVVGNTTTDLGTEARGFWVGIYSYFLKYFFLYIKIIFFLFLKNYFWYQFIKMI